MVERLFLAVPQGCLQFVIVVFPDHTHLLFFLFTLDFQVYNRITLAVYLTISRRYFFCGSFMFFSVLCFVCPCARLFICALWSPAGKGLNTWLSFVVSD